MPIAVGQSTYPYVIKNQRKARKPLVGGFGCLELVLYGIREHKRRSITMNSSEMISISSGPHCPVWTEGDFQPRRRFPYLG